MAKVAYLRVSSEGQNLERQEGLTEGMDRVFREKASGGSKERPALKELLEWVREGDQVFVFSIDRLARNLRDLQEIVDNLVAQGVSITFVKEKLSFSGDEEDANSRLFLQFMGAFAEFERVMIRRRQQEGIEKAKASGKYKGRAVALSEAQVREAAERYRSSRVSVSQLAREFEVSRSTLYKALKSQGVELGDPPVKR